MGRRLVSIPFCLCTFLLLIPLKALGVSQCVKIFPLVAVDPRISAARATRPRATAERHSAGSGAVDIALELRNKRSPSEEAEPRERLVQLFKEISQVDQPDLSSTRAVLESVVRTLIGQQPRRMATLSRFLRELIKTQNSEKLARLVQDVLLKEGHEAGERVHNALLTDSFYTTATSNATEREASPFPPPRVVQNSREAQELYERLMASPYARNSLVAELIQSELMGRQASSQESPLARIINVLKQRFDSGEIDEFTRHLIRDVTGALYQMGRTTELDQVIDSFIGHGLALREKGRSGAEGVARNRLAIALVESPLGAQIGLHRLIDKHDLSLLQDMAQACYSVKLETTFSRSLIEAIDRLPNQSEVYWLLASEKDRGPGSIVRVLFFQLSRQVGLVGASLRLNDVMHNDRGEPIAERAKIVSQLLFDVGATELTQLFAESETVGRFFAGNRYSLDGLNALSTAQVTHDLTSYEHSPEKLCAYTRGVLRGGNRDRVTAAISERVRQIQAHDGSEQSMVSLFGELLEGGPAARTCFAEVLAKLPSAAQWVHTILHARQGDPESLSFLQSVRAKADPEALRQLPELLVKYGDFETIGRLSEMMDEYSRAPWGDSLQTSFEADLIRAARKIEPAAPAKKLVPVLLALRGSRSQPTFVARFISAAEALGEAKLLKDMASHMSSLPDAQRAFELAADRAGSRPAQVASSSAGPSPANGASPAVDLSSGLPIVDHLFQDMFVPSGSIVTVWPVLRTSDKGIWARSAGRHPDECQRVALEFLRRKHFDEGADFVFRSDGSGNSPSNGAALIAHLLNNGREAEAGRLLVDFYYLPEPTAKTYVEKLVKQLGERGLSSQLRTDLINFVKVQMGNSERSPDPVLAVIGEQWKLESERPTSGRERLATDIPFEMPWVIDGVPELPDATESSPVLPDLGQGRQPRHSLVRIPGFSEEAPKPAEKPPASVPTASTAKERVTRAIQENRPPEELGRIIVSVFGVTDRDEVVRHIVRELEVHGRATGEAGQPLADFLEKSSASSYESDVLRGVFERPSSRQDVIDHYMAQPKERARDLATLCARAEYTAGVDGVVADVMIQCVRDGKLEHLSQLMLTLIKNWGAHGYQERLLLTLSRHPKIPDAMRVRVFEYLINHFSTESPAPNILKAIITHVQTQPFAAAVKEKFKGDSYVQMQFGQGSASTSSVAQTAPAAAARTKAQQERAEQVGQTAKRLVSSETSRAERRKAAAELRGFVAAAASDPLGANKDIDMVLDALEALAAYDSEGSRAHWLSWAARLARPLSYQVTVGQSEYGADRQVQTGPDWTLVQVAKRLIETYPEKAERIVQIVTKDPTVTESQWAVISTAVKDAFGEAAKKGMAPGTEASLTAASSAVKSALRTLESKPKWRRAFAERYAGRLSDETLAGKLFGVAEGQGGSITRSAATRVIGAGLAALGLSGWAAYFFGNDDSKKKDASDEDSDDGSQGNNASTGVGQSASVPAANSSVSVVEPKPPVAAAVASAAQP